MEAACRRRVCLGKALERTWACGKCRERRKSERQRLRAEHDSGGAPEGSSDVPSVEAPTPAEGANGTGPSDGGSEAACDPVPNDESAQVKPAVTGPTAEEPAQVGACVDAAAAQQDYAGDVSTDDEELAKVEAVPANGPEWLPGGTFNWQKLIGTEPAVFSREAEGEAHAAPAAMQRNWLEAIAAGENLAAAVRGPTAARAADPSPDGATGGAADARPAEQPRPQVADLLPESDDESGEAITQAQRDAGNKREAAAAAAPYRAPPPPVRPILTAHGGEPRRVRQRVTFGPTSIRCYRID